MPYKQRDVTADTHTKNCFSTWQEEVFFFNAARAGGSKDFDKFSPDIDMKSSADSSPSARQARLHSKYGVQFVKSKACAVCNLPFGVLRVRHSCRFCGLSVCNKCSPEKRLNSVSKNPKRICSECLKDEAADEVSVFCPRNLPSTSHPLSAAPYSHPKHSLRCSS